MLWRRSNRDPYDFQAASIVLACGKPKHKGAVPVHPRTFVKILTWLASPTGVFVCGIVLGTAMVVLSRRRSPRLRRAGFAVCAIAALQFVAFSWYPVADLIARPLEQQARSLAAGAPREGYTAIILLSGEGRSPPAGGSGQPPESDNPPNRVGHAARLYHAGLAPRIIVSGGRIPALDGTPRTPEAESLSPLLRALGVPIEAIVLEPQAMDTRENASRTRSLVGDQAKVAVITSAFHMPRALREMRSAGIDAHAFPTSFRIPSQPRPVPQRWLPNSDARYLSTVAIKEWLAILMQSMPRNL